MITRFLFFTFFIFCITSCSSRARLEMKAKQLPNHQLSQNYTYLSQKGYCGQEPIVRFANFTFDKEDSLRILVDITTSLSENKLRGDLSIHLDEYEIEYANSPTSKQYVETLEVESQSRYPNHFRGRQSLANVIIQSATLRKTVRKESQKQYWNTVSVTIEPEDEQLLIHSSDIYFSMKTERCNLMIYPSYEQVEELKRYLHQY